MDSLKKHSLCDIIYPAVLAPVMTMGFNTPFLVQQPFVASQLNAPDADSKTLIVHSYLAPFVMHLSNAARSFRLFQSLGISCFGHELQQAVMPYVTV
jgi:hypothetical protein